jgi:arginine decarboxylase-like protein
MAAFVDYYSHDRYHESLDKLTPADVDFGRGRAILEHRAQIKQKTIALRRKRHQQLAARHLIKMDQRLSSIASPPVQKVLTTYSHVPGGFKR